MNDTHLKLETFLPYRLAQVAEAVSRDFATLYRRRYGMTRPEWRVLATIGQFGTITATEIGAHSAMHKTKVSRAVRALEDRRWIARDIDDADRRVERLSLTREGRRCYGDLVAIAETYEQKLIQSIGTEAAEALRQGIAAIEARK